MNVKLEEYNIYNIKELITIYDLNMSSGIRLLYIWYICHSWDITVVMGIIYILYHPISKQCLNSINNIWWIYHNKLVVTISSGEKVIKLGSNILPFIHFFEYWYFYIWYFITTHLYHGKRLIQSIVLSKHPLVFIFTSPFIFITGIINLTHIYTTFIHVVCNIITMYVCDISKK